MESVFLGLALTVWSAANKELSQGGVFEEGANQEDFERHRYI